MDRIPTMHRACCFIFLSALGCSSAPVGEQNAARAPATDVSTPVAVGRGDAWSFAIAARDPRKNSAQPRAAALVSVEVEGLARLTGMTRTNAPDRPLLLRRTAETYVELSRSHAKAGDLSLAEAARLAAISHYSMLEVERPTHATMDEVLYFHALEVELSGDRKQARALHLDLLKRYPTSKYAGGSLFAFGEMFLVESVSDPSRKRLALEAYEDLVKAPSGMLRDEAKARIAALQAER